MISRQPSLSTVLYYLTDLLENFGVVNFYRKGARWKNNLQEAYCCFQYGVMFLYILSHFLSTITRSIHYVPHFLECLTEDVFLLSMFLQILSIKFVHKQFSELTTLMDHLLSRTDKKIVVEYQKAVKKICIVTIITSTCVISFMLIETFLPMTIEEIELEHKVYGTKFPHRQLPSRVLIPLVDETERVNYILFYVIQLYILYLVDVYFSVSFVLLPILILYLKDQYTVLAGYIEKIGQRHYDLDGNEIYFTNIDKHEYVPVGSSVTQRRLLKDTKNQGKSSSQKVKVILVKEYQPIQNQKKEINLAVNQSNRSLKQTAIDSTDTERHSDGILEEIKPQSVDNLDEIKPQSADNLDEIKPQSADNLDEIKPQPADCLVLPHSDTYQQNYIRQIIRFHQNVLVVNKKISNIFNWSLAVRTTGTFVSITLVLLQIISCFKTSGGIEWSSVCKLFVNILQSYLSCILSDMLDDCNTMLCRSIRNSHWYECDSRVRKDVWILLRMVQRSNHLVFYRGVIVLRPETLVKFSKFTYSFINCVRAKTGF